MSLAKAYTVITFWLVFVQLLEGQKDEWCRVKHEQNGYKTFLGRNTVHLVLFIVLWNLCCYEILCSKFYFEHSDKVGH